jgi:hypothetical protein
MAHEAASAARGEPGRLALVPSLYEKLVVDGRVELMLWAQEQGVSGS